MTKNTASELLAIQTCMRIQIEKFLDDWLILILVTKETQFFRIFIERNFVKTLQDVFFTYEAALLRGPTLLIKTLR
jgi:hypothetical protein